MIRRVGLAVLLLAAACATGRPPPSSPSGRTSVILLPDDRGKTGAVTVSGAGGERILSEPRQSVSVEAGAPPGETFVMPEKEVAAAVGPALKSLPQPPVQFILYFKHDAAELTAVSRARIKDVMRTIRERAPVDVSVVGHTDTVGDKPYNYQLSLKRARAVAALIEAEGVDPSILEITSHGKDNPLIPTGDQVSEPRNRRVEVTVR
jgi:outer membrane protein OmpA-like peptidoglycan-associated protein